MKTIVPLLFFAAAFSQAVAQNAPKVEVSGIRVIHRMIGEGFEGHAPFNAQGKGTSLALLVDAGSGGSIIEIDMDASKLDAFTDDKGGNLLTKSKGFNKDGFGAFPRIGKKAKMAIVEINGGGVPGKGSSAIAAKGTLVVHTASKKQTVKSTPFELKAGAKLKAGTIAMTVKKVGKPQFSEDDALEIELETKDKAIELVANARFLSATGAALGARSTGSGKMGFNKNYTYMRNYSFKKAVTGKVILELDVWTDFKENKIPFDIKAGVGGQ